jgi:hypothetical protein
MIAMGAAAAVAARKRAVADGVPESADREADFPEH